MLNNVKISYFITIAITILHIFCSSLNRKLTLTQINSSTITIIYMMYTIQYALIAYVISWIIGRYFIPRIILISKKNRLFDEIDLRKVHDTPIPRLGGVSFYPAILISFFITTGMMLTLDPDVFYFIKQDFAKEIFFFFAGLTIIFSVGLLDDIIGATYRQKFVIQTIAALVITLPIHHIESLHGLLGIYSIPLYISIPISTIAVVLIINAYNLIDGLDGLCSGLTIITITSFGVLFALANFTIIPILVGCTIGTLTIFFAYNVYGTRMKIFMGDSGSLMMGYIVSYVTLQYISAPATGQAVNNPEFVYPIALGAIFVPLFDASRVFALRLSKGKSPFLADRNHIHHLFLALGLSHIRCTFAIIGLQALICLTNIVLCRIIPSEYVILIDIVLGLSTIWIINKLISRREKQLAALSNK